VVAVAEELADTDRAGDAERKGAREEGEGDHVHQYDVRVKRDGAQRGGEEVGHLEEPSLAPEHERTRRAQPDESAHHPRRVAPRHTPPRQRHRETSSATVGHVTDEEQQLHPAREGGGEWRAAKAQAERIDEEPIGERVAHIGDERDVHGRSHDGLRL
jgi:hypothetical protein